VDDGLGALGPKEGPPVEIAWRWYYGVPSMPLWILLGLLVVVPPHNRNGQAWLILVLPLLVGGLGGLVLLATGPSENLEPMFYFLTALAIAWAGVWLVAPWLGAKSRVVRALVAWVVMFVIGAVGYVGYYEFTLSSDATGMWAVFWGIMSVTLVAAMAISGRCWRGRYPMYVFMFWLALWMPVVCLVCMICFCMIMAVAMGDVEVLAAILCSSVGATLVFSACLYILNVPVMVLARFSPVYRERFGALFGPLEPPEAFDSLPELRQPTWSETATNGDEGEGECPFGRGDSA